MARAASVSRIMASMCAAIPPFTTCAREVARAHTYACSCERCSEDPEPNKGIGIELQVALAFSMSEN